MEPWDVIVVGAGVTGLTLARLLDEEGKRVLVIDKGHRPGGRLASKTVAGMALDVGAVEARTTDPAVQHLTSRFAAAQWTPDSENPGHHRWLFPGTARDVASLWQGTIPVQSSFVTHVLPGPNGAIGVVRHGCDEPLWAEHVVLTTPIPQAQAIVAYSDLPLDYSLDAIEYHKRQILLAVIEGDGTDPDSTWSTDIIEFLRLRPRLDGLLGIEAFAHETWSEATWNDDATISQGRLLLELGVLLGRARVIDSQMMRWRYAVASSVSGASSFWSHPDLPGLMIAGDGFGDTSDRRFGIHRAVTSALEVHRSLLAR